jgi:UPF0176 protein
MTCNISAYQFVTLSAEQLPTLQAELKTRAISLDLKGSILLSTEGINLFVAGTDTAIESFKAFLESYPYFKDLPYKASPSQAQPFSRMLVKIKKEIISMGIDSVEPSKHTAPYVDAETLKTWYENNKDMVILDTRNDYEIALGKFENAVELDIKSFRDFPEAIKKLPEDMKNKTIVTYCTGGIRCEKAAEYMLQQGFKNTLQLDGGILRYFENCGQDHYEGECFVFDKRVAVDHELNETQTKQCYACRMPLTTSDQADYPTCPHCGNNAALRKHQQLNQSTVQTHE